jgi:hypothetical protein
MKRKAADIALTASRFSALVGVDRNEILNRLEDAGAEPVGRKNGGNEYSLRDLFHAAIGGDVAEQRLRKLRAEADHLELSLRTKRRELVPAQEAIDLITKCGWDIRQHILSMPIPHKDQDELILGMRRLSDLWAAEADEEETDSESFG